MKHPIVPLFVLPALLSCAAIGGVDLSAPAGTGIRTYDLTAGLHCKPHTGFLRCIRQHEVAAAKRLDVTLSRTDGQLCLSSPLSTKSCLRDRLGLRYAFLTRSAGSFVVVESWNLEAYTVLLVDEKTGGRTRVDSLPLLSHGARFFSTVSYDSDAGYLPNRVAVWDANTHAILYQVDRFRPGTGPVSIQWITPSRLQVRYSRSQYSPVLNDNAGTFGIWMDEKGHWRDDYSR